MTDVIYQERPWGNFTILDSGEGYLVKRLVVNPGQRTSFQRHAHRDEYWTVVSGFGMLSIMDNRNRDPIHLALDSEVTELADARIEKGVWHRATCESSFDPLVIIEVWRGDTLSEDDIERLEDDYGRV